MLRRILRNHDGAVCAATVLDDDSASVLTASLEGKLKVWHPYSARAPSVKKAQDRKIGGGGGTQEGESGGKGGGKGPKKPKGGGPPAVPVPSAKARATKRLEASAAVEEEAFDSYSI